MNSSCPECDRPLHPAATDCRCGWKKPNYRVSAPNGYQQCEWIAANEQCRYPGSITTNTHEGGPYFCRLHFGCDDGHWGAQIVEASRDYKHLSLAELIQEQTERAKENLRAKGLARRPDETPGAWRKRMIAFWKSCVINKRAA
jgi:hypothetical protein